MLESINQPSDLRDLDHEQLTTLAEEIRRFILEKVSHTGGHLSPNLGVVELTLALHRVFDSPRDRFIWDVGHQAYVHKIITGRADRFDSLRHTGGLSGYPSREESEHDFVENSHASTSLSYALGHALSDYPGWTVAIIGDGAFTGGMAYEALNHIAVARPERLIIILNDNGRSYAPTVGGLAALSKLAHYRIDPRYEKAKQALGRILRGIPLVGETADEMASRMKDAVKQILEPATVFDALNLKYSGAIDGHDIALLEETLEQAKAYREPVVVHVITEKGNGYQPAIEDDEEKLHGVGAFDLETGRAHKSELKLTEVAGRALAQAAETRPDLVAVSAAMVSTAGLREMARRFPDRVHDTGIAEQHTVTLAAGMAMAGKHPVVALYSAFLQRAFDQIVADIALHDLPVTFLIDRAGVTGPDGPSHHGVFDLSYLRMIPNLVIGAPADATELCAMIETAVDHHGPIAIRYPKGGAVSIPSLPVEPLPVGHAELTSEGSDVLLVAAGRMVEIAEKAAVDLSGRGVETGVVNARWVKPLDPRIMEWAAPVGLVVTLEDNVIAGGFGAAVMEAFSRAGMVKKVVNIGVPDTFLPFGAAADIIESVGMDPASVVEKVLLAVGKAS
ncbi:MAG TPA: 1-deoxy-D-xylulose-5-phosphate synthase [Acidimicrobiia bacterium]|jgi:1-deoxy-D-xylulose-5-phosphate synthase|nr:1-deoxy-D-xylulose-5-phosphate synthase [Acidimicrobiia bacterium]